MLNSMPQYWYNIETGEVLEDIVESWPKLLGPYDTREEATQALETARRRTEEWDKDEED